MQSFKDRGVPTLLFAGTEGFWTEWQREGEENKKGEKTKTKEIRKGAIGRDRGPVPKTGTKENGMRLITHARRRKAGPRLIKGRRIPKGGQCARKDRSHLSNRGGAQVSRVPMAELKRGHKRESGKENKE